MSKGCVDDMTKNDLSWFPTVQFLAVQSNPATAGLSGECGCGYCPHLGLLFSLTLRLSPSLLLGLHKFMRPRVFNDLIPVRRKVLGGSCRRRLWGAGAVAPKQEFMPAR